MKNTKGKKYKNMIQGLLGIIDGLIRFLSLGNYWTNFEYKFVMKNLGK